MQTPQQTNLTHNRTTRKGITNKDSLVDGSLSRNARYLLQERFLQKNQMGETDETPGQMFRRVAKALAAVELTTVKQGKWAEKFYNVMASMQFHPGTRTLANAGLPRQQLANCFVFPLADTQADIFKTLHDSSTIKGYGGGCGFNYSNIRPKGDLVRGVPDLAVGPVKLMKMFDMTTTMFRQQGRYESGNMAVLNVDHPDVFDFITAKTDDGTLSLTNMSLAVTDAFMTAVQHNQPWNLVNPRAQEMIKTVPARQIFEAACRQARDTGDPGMLFLDHINRDNPLREGLGDIIATNPCGEICLYPYESCNLGYLNLTKFLLPASEQTANQIFNEDQLREVISVGVRMIDNAVSASWFPIPEIQEAVQANRRIGLGVTGWADCLAIAGIPYASEAALSLAERLASTMQQAATETSFALGREKGPFSNVEYSIWRGQKEQPRNVGLLALPPSGNNAVIFDTSFSIEPLFALAYTENILNGVRLNHLNPHLVNALNNAGFPSDNLGDIIAENQGSIQDIAWIPAEIKLRFQTAHDIAPEWHVRMQAAFQKHVDNAISKTVNLPHTATTEDVSQVYQLAWELGCKGVTVYRDNSRDGQTIEFESQTEASIASEFSCAFCN